MSIRAIAPSGTTFSIPVKAVPPGVTVVPLTVVPSGGVVLLEPGGVTVVPLTVVPVEVVDVVELPGVVLDVVVSVVVVSVVVVSVVVVSVVELGGDVVLVVVLVEPAVQWEIVRTGVGAGPESSHVHVATALVA
jgi:hypothetical protein